MLSAHLRVIMANTCSNIIIFQLDADYKKASFFSFLSIRFNSLPLFKIVVSFDLKLIFPTSACKKIVECSTEDEHFLLGHVVLNNKHDNQKKRTL